MSQPQQAHESLGQTQYDTDIHLYAHSNTSPPPGKSRSAPQLFGPTKQRLPTEPRVRAMPLLSLDLKGKYKGNTNQLDMNMTKC